MGQDLKRGLGKTIGKNSELDVMEKHQSKHEQNKKKDKHTHTQKET